MSGSVASESDDGAIEAIAADWMLRLNDGPLPGEDQRALARWRADNPRHDEIFSSIQRTWADLDQIEIGPRRAEIIELPRKSLALKAPQWAGLGIAAAAVLALVLLQAPAGSTPYGEHATAIAQIAPVRLSDGSVVTLGANSRISERFDRNERRVVLENGEAFFEVAHDASRPFVVEAGDAIIRDVGTKFNVNRGVGRVSVAVLEGVVEVHAVSVLGISRGDPRTLREGERIELIAPNILSVSMGHVEPAAGPPGAWRQGRLVYNNARLGDLVADVNRYYQPGVALADPSLGDLRVTASFRTDQVGGIMDVLDSALPIEVSRAANGAISVHADPGAAAGR
jgi:transmembrane sensor